MKRTLLYIISTFLLSLPMMAQETETIGDSIPRIEKYGIRVGADLSKLIRTVLQEGYTGFEVMGDVRFYKDFYAAAELGNETRDWDEDNLTATTKGSFIKLGADYNAYNNWIGMENAIFVGLRYGFSTFSQELTEYTVYTVDPTFPAEPVSTNQEFSGLTASWVEMIAGVKTELVNNLFLSINVQLKRKVGEQFPENFDNLIIPGFNRTYDSSKFGVGYGYSISYLIPVIKRSEKLERKE